MRRVWGPAPRRRDVKVCSGQTVTATFGADGDEAPQRVRVD
ncbi:MAG TPA: hypothetical protein VE908_00960 [Mycobacterium sp.]|nr:hypothetical protein [Mycobacterium sp.]